MIYITKGERQSRCVDVWDLQNPPVYHKGNWCDPRGVGEPKAHWLPHWTIEDSLCRSIAGKVPKPGECLKLKREGILKNIVIRD